MLPIIFDMEQVGFEDAQATPRLLAIREKYVSEKPVRATAPGPFLQFPGHLQGGAVS